MRKAISLFLAVLMMLVLLPAVRLNGAAVADGTTVTDTLTLALTGMSGSTYGSWSGKKSVSDAVYAGQSAGSYDSIQLRTTNSNSGIITTGSGGKAR